MTTPAVFLDRDGTVIEDTNYVGAVADVIPIPGAADALVRLAAAGYALIVVTNQSGIGRGYFSRHEVDAIHEHLARAWEAEGATIAHFFVCPHHPDDGCVCRKPSPKFLFEAAKRYNIDLERSFMIGDSAADIGCGQAAGARSILVRTGKGSDTETRPDVQPDAVHDDLSAAADWILSCSN